VGDDGTDVVVGMAVGGMAAVGFTGAVAEPLQDAKSGMRKSERRKLIERCIKGILLPVPRGRVLKFLQSFYTTVTDGQLSNCRM
jgi:hypothetical protein